MFKAPIALNKFFSAEKPRKNDEFARVKGQADNVLRLVDKHTTPPYPKTYDLWYSYIGGDIKGLNDRIDAALERDGTLRKPVIDQLHQDFLSTSEADSEANLTTSKLLTEACADLQAMLEKHVASNESYGHSLDCINKNLKQKPTPEAIKQLITTLLSENSQMRHRAEMLNSKLNQSQKQLRKLNEDLTKTYEQTLLDSLTSIGNRKLFDMTLKKFVDASAQGNRNFCLVIADLDHFKAVNDNFGHVVGDAVIKLFAKLIRKNTRGNDVVARYGGEEFGLILPKTDLSGAMQVAEQVRKEIAMQDLQVTKSGMSLGQVTASFGIAQYQPGDSCDSILARADENLYIAKSKGRNRIAA